MKQMDATSERPVRAFRLRLAPVAALAGLFALGGCVETVPSSPGYDRGFSDGCNGGSAAAANPFMGFRTERDGGGAGYERGYAMGYDSCRERFNDRGR